MTLILECPNLTNDTIHSVNIIFFFNSSTIQVIPERLLLNQSLLETKLNVEIWEVLKLVAHQTEKEKLVTYCRTQTAHSWSLIFPKPWQEPISTCIFFSTLLGKDAHYQWPHTGIRNWSWAILFNTMKEKTFIVNGVCPTLAFISLWPKIHKK